MLFFIRTSRVNYLSFDHDKFPNCYFSRIKKLLVIGLVFPEPTSTAAGGRMVRLLRRFKKGGYEITFTSAASYSDRSAKISEVSAWHTTELNSDSFNQFIKELAPDVVMFDRFITEEQFGWRVEKECPKALKILDTEDLHFLRKGREKAIKSTVKFSNEFLFTDDAKREIASIYRCDLSLVISSFEMELLDQVFHVPKELLFHLPFQLLDSEGLDSSVPFEKRNGFMSIGNFRHAPNLDSVRFLKNEIWPKVRALLAEAELHIYGSYPTKEVFRMHNPKEGFLVHGAIENAMSAFKSARVCLTPLRFGAGQKGKIFDALKFGTPIITTEIGAESMFTQSNCPGFIQEDIDSMASLAVILHEEESIWTEKHELGKELLRKNFLATNSDDNLILKTNSILANLEKHRRQNFTGQILHFHTLRSTEFLSKFIQEKNKRINK